MMGLLLILAPPDWYGPTWHYFTGWPLSSLPTKGTGLGICCVVLGTLQLVALWFAVSPRTLSILLFFTGIVYWVSGTILFSEGLLGHQGLMESPFILYAGAHAFVLSAVLMADYRRERRK